MEIQLCHIHRICCLFTCNEMNHLKKTINSHKDGIISLLGLREAQYKVHAHIVTLVHGPFGMGNGIYNLALVAAPVDMWHTLQHCTNFSTFFLMLSQ
jgi:hypothetical protein